MMDKSRSERLRIDLTAAEFEALARLSEEQERSIPNQVRYWIKRGLIDAGKLPENYDA